MRASEARGVIYTNTHSNSRRVGRSGDKSGPALDAVGDIRVAMLSEGGRRRSTGMRLYTGECKAAPPFSEVYIIRYHGQCKPV